MNSMHHPRTLRRAWLGFLASAALAASGCGSVGYGSASRSGGTVRSATAPSPAELGGVPAAAARTLSQRALIGWRLNGAKVFGPAKAPVFGQGRFDFAAARGTETIDLPELRHQEPGTEHAVFLPDRVYLQPKARGFVVLPRGKQWVSASLVGSESVNTNFPGFLAQVEGVNPALLLTELEWGATASTPLGPGRQIVDHVRAQRYRVTVDLDRALARLGGPLAGVLSQAIQEQLIAGEARKFDVLTWVDHQGRVVQMQARLPGTGEGRMLLAISYFGRAVKVAVPRSGLVVDITSLTPSGERENNGGGDSDGG
jgi:hypothetical protein